MLRTIAAASVLAFAAAAPAMAQDQGTVATVYAGPTAGYHDLGLDAPGDDGGAIFGGVIGFDVPLSSATSGVVIGVEGNFLLGTGAIDHEYGVAGRLGYKFPSGGVAYVRGGYQWVDIDIENFAGVNLGGANLGISDVAKDYLVGVGGELPLGTSRFRVRAGIDTISFDSIRPTAALIYSF